MKKSILIFFTIIGLIFIISCEKDETKAVLKDSVTQPSIKSGLTDGQVITLNKADKDLNMQVVVAKPDFGFPASVTYSIQLDKMGNDFSKLAVVGSTSASDTVPVGISKLNTALLKLVDDRKNPNPVNVEVRVQALLTGTTIEPVNSNVIKLTITPFVP